MHACAPQSLWPGGVDAAPSSPPRSGPAVYRPRQPQATPLYRLLETRFETPQRGMGGALRVSFRILADASMESSPAISIAAFSRMASRASAARTAARTCWWPSRARAGRSAPRAERAAETANRLGEDVLEPVGLTQWVFTIPKMLRSYFLRHRELLGDVCRAAWRPCGR